MGFPDIGDVALPRTEATAKQIMAQAKKTNLLLHKHGLLTPHVVHSSLVPRSARREAWRDRCWH